MTTTSITTDQCLFAVVVSLPTFLYLLVISTFMGALNSINPCSYIIFVYNDSLTNSAHMGLHVKFLLRNRALPDTDRDDPNVDDVAAARPFLQRLTLRPQSRRRRRV